MEVSLNNQSNVDVELPVLKKLARHVLKSENILKGEISVTLVDDEVIAKLNKKYRGVDAPTDVLSFDLTDAGDDEIIGDVLIAPAIARLQAAEHGNDLDSELRLLITHGILHILGYDHDIDERAVLMEERERLLLDTFEGPRR